MSRQGLLLLALLILAIMFAPVMLGDGIAQFFRGLGIVFGRWVH